MKKFFLSAILFLALVSCGNSYIDKYEDLCSDTKDLVEETTSVPELLSVMKQFRLDIRELNSNYVEEVKECRKSVNEDGTKNKLYERRIKAYNSVSSMAAKKRKELKNK